mmetsp:Transcript_184666/g.585742  ORF Transcript_184666/g.585742 Transcript_184666/m.585742 type:complete len:85 (-) Transcript_184666:6-260(-)
MRKCSEARGDALIGQSNLALLFYTSGRNPEAEAWYRRSVIGYESMFGRSSSEAISARRDLQELLRRLGRPAEADRLGRTSGGEL